MKFEHECCHSKFECFLQLSKSAVFLWTSAVSHTTVNVGTDKRTGSHCKEEETLSTSLEHRTSAHTFLKVVWMVPDAEEGHGDDGATM